MNDTPLSGLVFWLGMLILAPIALIALQSNVIEMEITAYCSGPCCCGEWSDGITASGVPAEGLICAADLKYPFGTKFTVDGVVYVCQDRGGAIKGNKLDLLFPTHQEALEWGRRTIMVKVERPTQ